MPRKGFRSLTINKKTYELLGLEDKDIQKYMNQILIDKEKLAIFSSKIKKNPLIVTIYANPYLTEGERRTRNA